MFSGYFAAAVLAVWIVIIAYVLYIRGKEKKNLS